MALRKTNKKSKVKEQQRGRTAVAEKTKIAPTAHSALEPFTFQIEGMTCSSCVSTVERTLKKIPGISASVNFASETAHVMAPAELNPKIVIAAVKSAWYKAKYVSDASQLALHNRHSATALFFAAFFTIPLIIISMTSSWHPKIDSWLNQLIEKATEDTQAWWVAHRTPGLLALEDFGWLLECSCDPVSPDKAREA